MRSKNVDYLRRLDLRGSDQCRGIGIFTPHFLKYTPFAKPDTHTPFAKLVLDPYCQTKVIIAGPKGEAISDGAQVECRTF